MSINYRVLEKTDEPLLLAFFEGLSRETRQKRFLTDIFPGWIIGRILNTEYTLAAMETVSGAERIVGMGNICAENCPLAEIALVISDENQRQGIGVHLARELAEYAKARGCLGFSADISAGNEQALNFLKKFGESNNARIFKSSFKNILQINLYFQ